MINNPLISVVTVNYNQSAATCAMLESLFASGYSNLEVIVVDNASPSDTPEIIKEKYPQVHFIQSKVNLGFAGGNNIALRQVKGDYIYLLNNDTIIPAGHFPQVVSVLNSDPSIGVVSPKIKFFDNPDMIQFAGYTEMSTYTLRNKCIGYGEPDQGQYDQTQKESAFAHGAAMILKREVIERVGLMNEHYFLYYEELDWCARIKKAGYRIMYTSNTYILHKESLSTGKNSPLQTYYLNRNRILFTRCNTSGARKTISIIYQMFIAMPKNALVSIVRGQGGIFKAILNAWGWNLKNLNRANVCTFDHI